MIWPLLSLAGGLWLLTREQERPIGPQPHFPPELVAQIAVTRPLEGGGNARYFKADVAAGVLQALAGFAAQAVTPEQVPGGALPPGIILRLVPLDPAAPYGSEHTAQAVCQTAQSQGFIVLATLSAVLLSSPGEKLIMLCAQSERRLASSGSQWAVLCDAAGAPKVVEETPEVAAPTTPFDADLPAEVSVVVANLLNRVDATASEILAAADELDEAKYPLTVKFMRDRAASIQLRDRIRKAGNVPEPANGEVLPVAEVVGEVAVDGAGDGAVVIGSVMGPEHERKTKAHKKEAPPNGSATP